MIEIKDVRRTTSTVSFTLSPFQQSKVVLECMLVARANRSTLTILEKAGAGEVSECLRIRGLMTELLDYLFPGVQIYSIYNACIAPNYAELLIMYKPFNRQS